MRLRIQAQHDSLSDTVRAYAEKRIGKLDKRLHPNTLVELTLTRAHNPSIADDHSAEAIAFTKGPKLVAQGAATTYEAAIDELVEKLERQIEKYQDKRRLEPRRRAAATPPPPPLEEPESDEAAA